MNNWSKLLAKNFLKIILGCCFVSLAVIAIVIFIVANSYMEKDIAYAKITIDKFFGKYNNHELENICENMYSEYSINGKGYCNDILNEMYEKYGKEISYDINYNDSYVYIYNGKNFKISMPTKYEKYKKRYTNITMLHEPNYGLKIYDIGTSDELNENNEILFQPQYFHFNQ